MQRTRSPSVIGGYGVLSSITTLRLQAVARWTVRLLLWLFVEWTADTSCRAECLSAGHQLQIAEQSYLSVRLNSDDAWRPVMARQRLSPLVSRVSSGAVLKGHELAS